MKWQTRVLAAVLAVLFPLAVLAVVVELPAAPELDKGEAAQPGLLYVWPGSLVMSEGIDLTAEPIVPNPRAWLTNRPEEIGEPNATDELDDLTQIFIDGFAPGWQANWAGPYGGGYDSGGGWHDWIWTERTERHSVGNYAAYCAGDASEVPVPSIDTYPDDMITWMYYGPVDMSMYDGAAVEFDIYVDCETLWDNAFVGISTDGANYFGNFYSGYDAAWHTNERVTMDYFPGANSTVYFLFKFKSDYTVSNTEGVWIDQVRVYGEIAGLPDLRLTDITWAPFNPAAGVNVTVTLDYENAGPDNSGGFYVDLFSDTDGVTPRIGQFGTYAYYHSAGLAAGATASYSFTYSYPSNGTRWLFALIDTDGYVDEGNETNNGYGFEKLPVGIATIINAGPVVPNVVPVGGGVITYTVNAYQYTAAQSRPAWINISYEGFGNAIEVYATAGAIPMVPFVPRIANPVHFIPPNAPGGNYQINVNFGDYPWLPFDSGRTFFSKAGPVADGIEDFEGVEFETRGLDALSHIAADGVAELSALPSEFAMGAAYPNPFNPSTAISIALPETENLNLVIYNLQGREVATLASGQYPAGIHKFVFDAHSLASGVYLIQARTGAGDAMVQKLVLTK